MRMYATVTSERATKGQGGNRYIEVKLNVGSASDSVHVATVRLAPDNFNKGEYMLHVRDAHDVLLFGQLIDEPTKGEQQKGWQQHQVICMHRWHKPYANKDIQKCVLCDLTKGEQQKGEVCHEVHDVHDIGCELEHE